MMVMQEMYNIMMLFVVRYRIVKQTNMQPNQSTEWSISKLVQYLSDFLDLMKCAKGQICEFHKQRQICPKFFK